jgi:hypothetical protein
MSRPDFERIRRNAAVVLGGAGETATLRRYVSGTTGARRFGGANTYHYTEQIVTGMFASNIFGAPRPTERNFAGGQVQDSQLMVTLESAVGARDELVWRGTAYRVAGDAMPEVIGGRVLWRNPLALAGQTG